MPFNPLMRLEYAERLAKEFVALIKPYCSRVEIAGSIRRRRPEVRDIDLVAVVDDPFTFNMVIRKQGHLDLDGPMLKRINPWKRHGVQVDVYITDEETFAPILLIRTGSPEHNIKLASHAKRRGLQLTAQGVLDAGGRRLDRNTEASIFEALGLSYKKPEEREV